MPWTLAPRHPSPHSVPLFSCIRLSSLWQHRQLPTPTWVGGHCTERQEQNTQQSPGFGRRRVRQRYWQASVGMVSALALPHTGQVMLHSTIGLDSGISVTRAENSKADQ
jgi:hypothetical protein